MTEYQIEVRAVAERHDLLAQQLARDISHIPRTQLPALAAFSDRAPSLSIHTARLYQLSGQCTPAQIDLFSKQLLVDPVVQSARIVEDQSLSEQVPWHVVDVFLHPGVTDTLAESVLTGAALVGLSGLTGVVTGQRYFLDSRLSIAEVRTIAEALLYNPVIQNYLLRTPGESSSAPSATPAPASGSGQAAETIPFVSLSDAQLVDLSRHGLLALNLAEMRTIQRYYRAEGREPTMVELETLAQTWSEHCSHKTFKATIRYQESDQQGKVLLEETITNLLKTYIMRATEQVARPWVVSAFSDNAGLIRFTEGQDLAFKVETHNHPSAIEPFGGANTGVGGVIRDVLGVSAQPIACTDVLCFGPPATPVEELPAGILAPRRIASGVVSGVRDYGNKMGIPTVNGAVLYHRDYLYNPLVFCGCLGILPHGSHPRQVQPGDLVVVLGGRTGRDGIHGATFSSGEMSSESNALAGTAVQIGAPITEKKVSDVIIQARDLGLYNAITDCGAGGFSSAIGEMGAETGVRVDLARAPLKYQGLAPWEIWLSEAQERMVLAVPPAKLSALLAICAIEEVEASVLGAFTSDQRLLVIWGEEVVANLALDFLHDGRPARVLDATWIAPDAGSLPALSSTPAQSYDAALLALLSHPSIASKEEIVRRYDHEVQGATIGKPLVGRAGNGPGDAAVLRPLVASEPESRAGVILANGINPLHGQIDPHYMALCAVDEALRNLTAVGGDIERAALLDNFCWGNPTDPQQLGLLVRAVKGCYEAAVGFGTPFISGKDSLNNEYRLGDRRLPVLPTLLISAVGVIDDAAQTCDMAFKVPGDTLYLVGVTRPGLAGSHYAAIAGLDHLEAGVYGEIEQARASMRALGSAIRSGLVRACHDLSEGGLATAVAEMALAGLLGARLDISSIPALDLSPAADEATLLFGETPSRFLVAVAPEQCAAFEAHLLTHGVRAVASPGAVTASERLIITAGPRTLIDLSIADLQAAWKGVTE